MDLAARLVAAQEGRATGVVLFEFPDAARELIRTNRKRKNRGESTDPALDGHLGLCRMKAAAALALLHGEREVTTAVLGHVRGADGDVAGDAGVGGGAARREGQEREPGPRQGRG